jgi:hypothetical protein
MPSLSPCLAPSADWASLAARGLGIVPKDHYIGWVEPAWRWWGVLVLLLCGEMLCMLWWGAFYSLRSMMGTVSSGRKVWVPLLNIFAT